MCGLLYKSFPLRNAVELVDLTDNSASHSTNNRIRTRTNYRILQDTTGYYRILQDTTGYFRIL